MSAGFSAEERAVVAYYTGLVDEAHRAWRAVGIVATSVDDHGVLLSDSSDPNRVYAHLTGGMFFGLSCYLQEVLSAAEADAVRVRADLLGRL